MKKLVNILLLISVFGCTPQQTEQPVSITDLTGNWEYLNSSGKHDAAFNLYVEDDVCHFGTNQDNRSRFHLKDETLVIKHADGKKHRMQILKHTENTLTITMKTNCVIDGHHFKKGDTLVFRKRKQKNRVKVNRIVLVSSQCSDNHASFQLQIDQSKNVFYNGLACTEKKGYYVGKIDPVFWEHLVNKVQYTDLKYLKTYAGQNPTDEQTMELILETNQGDYRCIMAGSNVAPSTLRDLIEYLFSNYKHIELQAIDMDNPFQFDSSPKGKIVKDILEKIPC